MNIVTKTSSHLLDTRIPVGPVEWAGTHTRLYGVDSIGQVFVFKTPGTPPRHRALSHAGRLSRLLAALRNGPVFS